MAGAGRQHLVTEPRVPGRRARRALAAILTLAAAILALGAAPAVAAPAVTNTADHGPGSLREAILHASPGDEILVPAGVYRLESTIAIPTEVSLVGSSLGTYISGNGTFRLMETSSGLSMSGLTLENGTATGAAKAAGFGGGGLYDSGPKLSIDYCQFYADRATAGPNAGGHDGGGAIYVSAGGEATISNTLFSVNSAKIEGGDDNGGASVFMAGSGKLALEGDAFFSSTLTDGGGGEDVGGGAVHAAEAALKITGTLFELNSSQLLTTSGYFAQSGGGAVFAGHGVEVQYSSFKENAVHAQLAASAIGGGGLFAQGANYINGSTFSANTVEAATITVVSIGGGGVWERGELQLQNSTLSGNAVHGSGTVAVDGGGLYVVATGTTSLDSDTIASNGVDFSGGEEAYGGGIFFYGEGAFMALSDTLLAENSVSGPQANGPGCYVPPGSPFGIESFDGHNLDESGSCGLNQPTDLNDVDALLAPLGQGGGPTETRPLLPGSPALGAGLCVILVDQRGFPRPERCDIGAFQTQSPENRAVPTVSGNATVGSTLKCEPGTWIGDAPLVFGYAWTVAGAKVPGATSASFTIPPADAGRAAGCVVTATNAGGRAEAASATVSVAGSSTPGSAPRILSATQSAARWRRGRALPAVTSRRRPPTGTVFTFNLSEPAKLVLSFTHSTSGRRVGARCVAVSHRNRHHRPCRRVLTAGRLTLPASASTVKLRFQGRLSPLHALRPGTYALHAVAVDAAGRSSQASTLSFTIVG